MTDGGLVERMTNLISAMKELTQPKATDSEYLHGMTLEERNEYAETTRQLVEASTPEAIGDLTLIELGALRQLLERGVEHRAKLGLFHQARLIQAVLNMVLAEIERRK